jgi:DNA-binding response OmpR family regulator
MRYGGLSFALIVKNSAMKVSEGVMFRSEEHTGILLLIEDSREVAESVGDYLDCCGYSVDFAADGISGLHLAVTNSYDAIILDLRIPGMDGLDVCRKLRGDAKNATPILMLTGRNMLEDKLLGLQAGADDYLVKPFEVRELEARLRALIRRDRRQVSSETLTVGDLAFDTSTLRLMRAGKELTVSPIGLRILGILMRESPRVVNRRDIEREIWGDTLPDSDTLRSHLYNLRRVIDKPFNRPLLHTIHSAGYRLADLNEEGGGKNIAAA